MDRSKNAEIVLSLAMEPGQAASIGGELREIGSSRDLTWFWSNVFQTLAASIWRGAKTPPLIVQCHAIGGCLVGLAASVFWGLVYIAVIGFLFAFLVQIHVFAVLPLAVLSTSPVGELIASYVSGKWVARHTGEKTFAVCLGMYAVAPLVSRAIAFLVSWYITRYFPPSFIYPHPGNSGWSWWAPFTIIPFFLGALRVRHQQRSQAT